MDLSLIVKRYIQKQNLCQKGDSILLGVSGGPDSVVLAHILFHLRHALGIHLTIAHFNHRLRRGSSRDELFVQALAKQMDIPFYKGHWEHSSKKIKGSLEEMARKQRLAFFEKVSQKAKTNLLALAHTEDDLAETMLMRVLRGSGLQGFQGIRPKRKLDRLTVIRPLLEIQRQEIMDFAKKNHIPFRVDPSNKKTVFFRNKIRLDLLPLLRKEYNKDITSVLANLSHNVSVDYDYLYQTAQAVYPKLIQRQTTNKVTLKLKALLKQPQAIQRLIIRQTYKSLKGDTKALSSSHIRDIESLLEERPVGSLIDLPHKIQVQKGKDFISIVVKNKNK